LASFEFLFQAGQFAAQTGEGMPAQLFDFVAATESSLRQLGENASEIGAVIVSCCQRVAAIEYGTSPISASLSSGFPMGTVSDPIKPLDGDSGGASFTYAGGTAILTDAGGKRLQGWSQSAWNTPGSQQSEANFFLAYAAALIEIADAIQGVHDNVTQYVQLPIGGPNHYGVQAPHRDPGRGPAVVPTSSSGPSTSVTNSSDDNAPLSQGSPAVYPAEGCWTGMMADSTLYMVSKLCDSLALLATNVRNLSDQLTTVGNELIPDPLAWFKSALLYLIDAAMALITLALTFGPAIAGAIVGGATAAAEVGIDAGSVAVDDAVLVELDSQLETVVLDEAGLIASEFPGDDVLVTLDSASETLSDVSSLAKGTNVKSGLGELDDAFGLSVNQAVRNAGEDVNARPFEPWVPGRMETVLKFLGKNFISGTLNAGSSEVSIVVESEIEGALYGRPPSASDLREYGEAWWEWAAALFGGTVLANLASDLLKGVSAIARLLNRTTAEMVLPRYTSATRQAIADAIENEVPLAQVKPPAGVSDAQWWIATSKPLDGAFTGLNVAASYGFYAAAAELEYVFTKDPNIKPNWEIGVPVSLAYWFAYGAALHTGLSWDPAAAKDYPALAALATNSETNKVTAFLLKLFGQSKELANQFPVQQGIGATIKMWMTSVLYANTMLTSDKLDWLPVVQNGGASGSHPGTTVSVTPDYEAIANLIKAIPDDNSTTPSRQTQAVFDMLAMDYSATFLPIIAAQHVAALAQGRTDPMASRIQALKADAANGAKFATLWQHAVDTAFDDYSEHGADVLSSYEAKAEMMRDLALWSTPPGGTPSGKYHDTDIDTAMVSANTDDVWAEWVAAMKTYAGSDPSLNRVYKWALLCYDSGVDVSAATPGEVLQLVRNVDNVLLHNGWLVGTPPAHVVTNSSMLMPITNPTLVDHLLAA
jgi:hypothetical protein